jgi:glucose-1-phosphate thymidylyltransferase
MVDRPVLGVVPAAGRGRRLAGLGWRKDLYPLGWDELEIGGTLIRRPRVVAAYTIDSMIVAGVDRIFLIVGDTNEVMAYFGDRRGAIPFAYLPQTELRGGAFAIDLAREWLPDRHDVLFGFPDTIIEPGDAYSRLLQTHRRSGADLTLGLFTTDRASDFGMVRLRDGRPVEIVDKPTRTDLTLMYGLACWTERFTLLQRDFMLGLSRAGEVVPAELFTHAIDSGLAVEAHAFDGGRYRDVGTPAELRLAQIDLAGSVWRDGHLVHVNGVTMSGPGA